MSAIKSGTLLDLQPVINACSDPDCYMNFFDECGVLFENRKEGLKHAKTIAAAHELVNIQRKLRCPLSLLYNLVKLLFQRNKEIRVSSLLDLSSYSYFVQSLATIQLLFPDNRESTRNSSMPMDRNWLYDEYMILSRAQTSMLSSSFVNAEGFLEAGDENLRQLFHAPGVHRNLTQPTPSARS